MSDSLGTIIAIFVAAILMFIFPLMAITARNDDIVKTTVQTTTTEFVQQVATEGHITKNAYEDFITKLYATGNSYDVQIEVKVLDENPGKKTVITSPDLIGENVTYSVYTSKIEEEIFSEASRYKLKQGDTVIVTVKNTNVTIATQLTNFFYRMVGKGTYQIGASASALVVNTAPTNYDVT